MERKEWEGTEAKFAKKKIRKDGKERIGKDKGEKKEKRQ